MQSQNNAKIEAKHRKTIQYITFPRISESTQPWRDSRVGGVEGVQINGETLTGLRFVDEAYAFPWWFANPQPSHARPHIKKFNCEIPQN